MLPYYVLIFLPILSQLLMHKQSREKRQKFSVSLFFTLLLFLLMLRSPSIGRDLPNYKYIFFSDSNLSWNNIFSSVEPAYAVLNKLVASITENFQWLLAVVAIICVVPIAYVYKKESEDASLTISLYITMSTFVMLFSGLRQSIAISLGMIAYLFVKKRKPIPYLLIVLLAFLFHRSAFMLLLMYPIYYMRIKRKHLIFLIPLLALIFIFNAPIFAILVNFISDIYSGSVSETGAFTMLVLFIIFLLFSFVVYDEEQMNDNVIGMRNFLILAVIIQMFAPLHSLAMRMNYYYIVFIPLLISKIVTHPAPKWRQVAKCAKYIMIVFFVAYFVFTDHSDGGVLNTFPYKFFWDGV